jgi:hypothetical protein
MNHALAILLIASLSGLSPWAAAADQPQGTVEDTGQRCVSLKSIRSTKVLDDQTILFEMSGKQMLVNRLPRRCPGLGFEKRFGYKTSLSQLCSTDIISVITDIGPGARCGLGMFTPWVAPEAVTAPAAGKLEPAPDPAAD